MNNSENPESLIAPTPSRSFVAVDWGTSSFRLWSLSDTGEVLGRFNGPFGMSTLEQSQYTEVLEQSMDELDVADNTPVVVCGMAGAAQGWHEAPYMPTSEDLFSLGRHAVRVPDLRRDVHILPGVKQTEPSNVMRGEETQILGLLATKPNFEGVVCMPGTHTKWVRIRGGYIERFTTCMTGELFALLSEQSVLRHSVATSAWDESAFDAAITDAINSPAGVATSLFGLRSSSLLDNQLPETARARLSGMLIGVELAATADYWKAGDVALIGEPMLCQTYSNALALQQIQSLALDAESLTLSGLITANNKMESQSGT